MVGPFLLISFAGDLPHVADNGDDALVVDLSVVIRSECSKLGKSISAVDMTFESLCLQIAKALDFLVAARLYSQIHIVADRYLDVSVL